jgi:Arc/MetJ-type ribon-helix-helix transcriptional regulator
LNKKQDIVSYSMPLEMQEKLKRVKTKKGYKSVSKLIRDLVDKYVFEDDDIVPVVLKVPAQLRGNPEALRQWLTNRLPTVVASLSQNEIKAESQDE